MSIIIGDLSRFNIYTAAAGQTTFAYSFPIYVNTELKVYEIATGTVGDDATDLLTLTAHYSVTGVGVAGGGTIVLVTGAPVGTKILIVGNTTTARTSQFSVNFNAEDLNTDLNKLLLMIQDLRTTLDHRVLKYDNCTNAQTGDIHLPQLAANQIWRKNATNTGIAAVSIEEASGWSTLRSELISQISGADGARLIGYYDTLMGAMTLKNKLDIQGSVFYGNTSGINDYALILTGYTHHSQNIILLVDFLNSNTSRTCTLSINGMAAIPVKYQDGEGLWYGDLVAAKWTMLVYTNAAGGIFHAINPNRYDGFIGEMKWFSTTILPDKWVYCFGQEVSRITFATLFAYIGVTWGAGNGSTTFNLPNFNDRMLHNHGFEGVSHSGGERNHILAISEMPAHTHSPATPKYITQDASIQNAGITTGSGSYGLTPAPSAGGGVAHNNMSPYAVACLAIKVC